MEYNGNENDVSARGLWSSRLMFILAAAGSAIGLGNIWKFPYIAGRYGGGAFVLFYLLCILVVGLPLLVAEIMIGREARKNPVGAFAKLSKKNPLWLGVGFLGVASGFVILSYYSVVAGWNVDYFTKSASGEFMGKDAEAISALFDKTITDPWEQIGWHTVFMVATIGIVIFGVKEGLERWIGILMPLLFILLVVLVVYGLIEGDAKAGLTYLFVPDWKKLVLDEAGKFTARPMLEAMGHAFFTLSLGMGAMITYGSYLGDDESLPGAAVMVAGLDTLIAMLASIAIFTILFKYNLDPAGGPGLLFKVLPLAFAQMPLGRLMGTAFFLLIAFAALTSAISLLEVVVAYFIDDRKWARRVATLSLGAVIWFLGIFSALSYTEIFNDFKPFEGKQILDSVDLLATNYMLPIGGFFIIIFAAWRLKGDVVLKQLTEGGKRRTFHDLWLPIARYVSPILVFIVIMFMINQHLGIF